MKIENKGGNFNVGGYQPHEPNHPPRRNMMMVGKLSLKQIELYIGKDRMRERTSVTGSNDTRNRSSNFMSHCIFQFFRQHSKVVEIENVLW